jgi:hypothetical protein
MSRGNKMDFLYGIIRNNNAELEISAAGDLLCNIVGTITNNNGMSGICGADVIASGFTPSGKWENHAVSGENGIFKINFPHASIGDIKLTAVKDGIKSTLAVNSADIARRLTPVPAKFPKGQINLEGNWDFIMDPPENIMEMDCQVEWNTIKVPSHWEMEGFYPESVHAVFLCQAAEKHRQTMPITLYPFGAFSYKSHP